MAFTPDAGGGFVPDQGSSSNEAASFDVNAFFGSSESKSKAVEGAEAFKAAAKSGEFRIDPERAKAAIRELERAEWVLRESRRDAEVVAQEPPIGGSPYARQIAAKYAEGGNSAREALVSFIKVIRLTREGYEAAIKNYQRTDDDSAQTFHKGL